MCYPNDVSETEKNVLKFIWKLKGPQRDKKKKKSWKKRTKRRTQIFWFPNGLWSYGNGSTMAQTQGQTPEINSRMSGKLIFDEAAKTIQWRKNRFFLTNGAGKCRYPDEKEWSWTPALHHIVKNQLKMYKELKLQNS